MTAKGVEVLHVQGFILIIILLMDHLKKLAAHIKNLENVIRIYHIFSEKY